MSDERNHAYFTRREQECRDAAKRATDPSIRRTHLDFAQRYAAQVEETRPRPQ